MVLISYNDALINLSSLGNVELFTCDSLFIYQNYSLASCDVEFVCNYIANPNSIVEIYGNTLCCNSLGEVQEACDEGSSR